MNGGAVNIIPLLRTVRITLHAVAYAQNHSTCTGVLARLGHWTELFYNKN